MTKERTNKFTEWMKVQNAGLWFGVAYLLFSVLWFVLSFQLRYYSNFGPGPGMYPRWLSGVSIIIAVVYIINSCTKQKFLMGDTFPGGKELLNVITMIASCIIFLLLLDVVGFGIAGSLLLFVTLFRNYKWWQAAIISVVTTAICFFVFKICFSVPLPVNALGF